MVIEHNKSVEREAFIDSVRVKSGELEDEFLFEIFSACCVSMVQGNYSLKQLDSSLPLN